MTKVVFASEFVNGHAHTAAFARRSNSLARELAKLGMKMWLVTGERGESAVSPAGVAVVRFPYLLKNGSRLGVTGRSASSLAFGWAFARFVRRVAPDVVIASFHEPIQGLLAVLAGRMCGAHTIFDSHDSWLVLEHEHAGAMRNWLRKVLENNAFHLADNVTTVTPTLRDTIATGYRLALTKIHVVYNGADHSQKTPVGEQDVDVIHLGSPRAYYHTLEALDAIAHVRRSGLPARFVFLGSTGEEYVTRVREKTARLGLQDLVEFVPPVSFDVVGEWLDRAKVALHTIAPDPVYKCAIGMKVFEYLAHGLPIVHMGSLDGETAKLIRHRNCGLVAETPQELGEVLVRVLRHEGLRQKLSNAAHQAAHEYSWEKSAKSIAQLIDRVPSR